MSRLRSVVASALVAVSTLVGAPAQAERPPVDVVLDLHPPEGVSPGDPVTALEQRGSAQVDVAVATLDGGSASWSRTGDRGLVIDLPSATSAEVVPRAVLTVSETQPSGGAAVDDALAPGARSFSFGAEFRTSLVRMGRHDDGDNIIQRGLASDESQYKLEVAGGRVACALTGSRGTLQIHVGPPVDPRSWYTAHCTRLGEAVMLWVAERREDGTVQVRSRTRHGPLGIISWSDKRPPVTVGGKANANGQPVRSATDQLNGTVARPVLVFDSSLAPMCAAASCPYAVTV